MNENLLLLLVGRLRIGYGCVPDSDTALLRFAPMFVYLEEENEHEEVEVG